MSRLAWGVWVEIFKSFAEFTETVCHASHEACELKLEQEVQQLQQNLRHASHEACELKLCLICLCQIGERGHASHEACELKWKFCFSFFWLGMSRLAWGVWVEIAYVGSYPDCHWLSRLAWGVWVEILLNWIKYGGLYVTPRMRRVSWNVFLTGNVL